MMLHSIQGISARKGETTRAFVERYDAVVRLKNGIEKLQKLVDKEIQLRRRFEYNDKEKFMKNFGKKVVTAFVTIIMAAGVALGFAACNKKPQQHITPPSQQQTPGGQETPGEQTPGGEQQTPGGEEQPGGEQTGGEQPGGEQNPGGEQPGGEGQKPGPGGEQQPGGEETTTEAEYKAKFDAELPKLIEEKYNETMSIERFKISDVNVLAMNKYDGNIYFTCMRNGREGFFVSNCEAYKNCNSFSDCQKNILDKKDVAFSFSSVQSRITENGVPEDICAFALSQDEVQTELLKNGVNASDIINYEVINTTEFKSSTNGICSDVTMLIGNKLVTLSIGGHTGTCSSQREYLSKLQSGRLSVIENIKVTDYEALALDNNKTATLSVELPNFLSEEDAEWYTGTYRFDEFNIRITKNSNNEYCSEI